MTSRMCTGWRSVESDVISAYIQQFPLTRSVNYFGVGASLGTNTLFMLARQLFSLSSIIICNQWGETTLGPQFSKDQIKTFICSVAETLDKVERRQCIRVHIAAIGRFFLSVAAYSSNFEIASVIIGAQLLKYSKMVWHYKQLSLSEGACINLHNY